MHLINFNTYLLKRYILNYVPILYDIRIRRGCAPGFINYKLVHSIRRRKWYSLPVACPWSMVLSGYSGFLHN